MTGELTGFRVLMIFLAFFGTIFGVNFYMAYQAVHSFPGLVVANSYVASQEFDANRAAQEALGWTLTTGYADGALQLAFTDRAGQPAALADLSVLVGRTTGTADDRYPTFTPDGGTFRSQLDLPPGRWMLRVKARAADGTRFEQKRTIYVKGT